MRRLPSDPPGVVDTDEFRALASGVAELGRGCYQRAWAVGTSGNFSAVLGFEPFRLAITASGVDKGSLTAEQVVCVDARGALVFGTGKPSAETLIHLAIARIRGAPAIAHTHSLAATILSERHVDAGGLAIEGYEMLKGLAGISTHETREWVPILRNSQDYRALAPRVEGTLLRFPDAHGILLSGHGLYTWGAHLQEVKRHVEVLEFLFEVLLHSDRAPGDLLRGAPPARHARDHETEA